jgi:hypothetical protein
MDGAQMKYCKDCRRAVGEGITWVCRRPLGRVSPVTGDTLTLNRWCAYERVDPTGCGPEGAYWEEKT